MYKNVFFKKKISLYELGPVFWNKLIPNKLALCKFNHLEQDGLQENIRLDNFKDFMPRFRRQKIIETDFNFLVKNIGIVLSTFLFILLVFKKNTKKAKCEEFASKPYLGCSLRSKDDGMQIVMIKSDSPAEKAGLMVKDIILEIDGKKISSINEYNAAIGYEANRKKIKILRKINNDEVILYINVDFINL